MLEDQRLESVHYFTARVSGGGKERRQRSYLDALGTLPRDRVTVRYGKYQMSPRTCLHCGAQDEVPGEKMTDVNIAVEMLTHAFQDRFDTALLISGDSDLRGPVERIRTLFPAKKVVIAFRPGRFSAELKAAATAVFRIGRANLAKSQFPERIETPDLTVKRPETWS